MNSGNQSTPSRESVSGSVLGPVLQVLNELEERGLLDEYAIGGAVGVLYYVEPVLTYDFDVICHFPGTGPLIDPGPLFAELKRRGYTFGEEDRIVIEGVPVQFIPADPGLLEEALGKAVTVEIEGVATRMLTLEHLMANMLKIHRPKDRAKLALIAESHPGAFNPDVLGNILRRYDLSEKWERCYGPEAGD